MSDRSEDDWAYFIEKMGEPRNVTMPTEAELAHYGAQLPQTILDFWRRFGFCTFEKGRAQLVNPAWYADAVAAWVSGTELEGTNTFHAIIVSGFGEMDVWGEKTGSAFTTSVFTQDIWLALEYGEGIKIDGPEFEGDTFMLSGLDPDGKDAEDKHGYMYDRAREKLGLLAPNEIYGFVPALALGGPLDADHLERMDGGVHQHMLAQMAPPTLRRD